MTAIRGLQLNRLVGIGLLLSYGGVAWAEADWATEPPVLRPNKTLSAAAAAAQAAAAAAGAAARAAAAAADAAAAAVDAVNSVMASSRRPDTVPNGAEASLAADPANLPAAEEADSTSATGDRFAAPTERSLVGIAGALEVPVITRNHASFAQGLAEGAGAEPVRPIEALNLAQAVESALGFNRDVLAAGAKVDQAVAQTGQARAFLLPSLMLNMKTGRETSEPGVLTDPATGRVVSVSDHDRSDSSITLKQPLYDGPSYADWRRREVIELSRQASRSASVGDAYLSTVNAYLALASSRVLSDMAQDYQNQLGELFTYVEKRTAAGVASNSDRERVRARSLSAQSARLEQESAHAAAGIEFVRLVNLLPGSLRIPDVQDVGLSAIPASLEVATSLALESSPEMAVANAELRAAELEVQAARKRYLPRLDLELSSNESVHAGGASGSQKDRRLMLTMNWALFSGLGDARFIDEKAARYNELRFRLDDTRRKLLQGLSSQYAQLAVTRKRIDTGYLELQATAAAARAVSKRMLAGNQSLLDVLDVYDRHYQVRLRLVNLHVLEIGSLAQIGRVLQGSPPLAGGLDASTPVATPVVTPVASR